MEDYQSSCSMESYNLVNVQEMCKDVIKNNLRALNIHIEGWEQMIVNQSTWKKVIYESYKVFEAKRIKHTSMKQALQENLILVPDTL